MRDWENLRYFLAVARQGTVSGAAKDLGVSHSTVLRRVEQFETALDAKLFKKLQRGYELTTAGEQLFNNAKLIENDIDQVMAQAEGHHDVTEGKLRISQPENGIIDFYPVYAKFLRAHPEISLQIHSTMEIHNLNQQEVDVALRIATSPPDLLVGRSLGAIESRAYASKNYLARVGTQRSIKDYDWVLWDMMAQSSVELLQPFITDPHIIIYAKTMLDVLSAVRNDMGAGLLSSHEAEKYPELVPLFDNYVFRTHDLWILTHRELRNSERVTNFMRFMAEHLHLNK